MSKWLSLTAILSLATLAGIAAASPGAKPKPFTVASSLDRKTVLPHRIRWLAYPKLPRTQIREVAFLIDGKVRWVEHNAPYSYSEDGGYLVTSWLAAGRHRFTVRATSTSGRTAMHTVVARVVPAPEPAPELAGKWQRDVPAAVPADAGCGAADPVPAGRWTLIFERRWIETVYPGKFDPRTSKDTLAGSIIDNDWVPGPTTFQVAGSVTVNLILDSDPRGGWWCEPWGPGATYSWSVSGDTLTLRPVGGVDRNGQRGGIFTGEWKRVS
jgi:hypothetical protein